MNEAEPPQAYVRLTSPAIGDLQRILAKDPQIVRAALKKMILLERDPFAGEPLLGSLIGWRKVVVGDNHWRVVWQVSSDQVGNVIITISEVWAVGARSDAEVYGEMNERLASADQGPAVALSRVIELLGKRRVAEQLDVSVEPIHDPVPPWLRQRLMHTARMSSDDVDRLTGEAAMRRWEQYMTGTTPD